MDEQNAQTLACSQDQPPHSFEGPHAFEDEPISPNIPIILEPEMSPTHDVSFSPQSPAPLSESPGAMATLAVPSAFYYPSDGESSVCTTPGSVSPASGSPRMSRACESPSMIFMTRNA